MSRLDRCHQQIVNALKADGCTVNPQGLVLRLDRKRRFIVDIEGYHPEAQQFFVVEVKCFNQPTAETADLYHAIGQYLVYRDVLRRLDIETMIYLAVPTYAYDGIISDVALPLRDELNIKMIVVDVEREIIRSWIR